VADELRNSSNFEAIQQLDTTSIADEADLELCSLNDIISGLPRTSWLLISLMAAGNPGENSSEFPINWAGNFVRFGKLSKPASIPRARLAMATEERPTAARARPMH